MGQAKILDRDNLPKKLETLSSYCKNIEGEKFDKLTVIYPSVLKKEDGSILWVCQCDCGNYILRSGPDLRRKSKHSCGQHRREEQQDWSNKLRTELNGQIFNNLEVIDFDYINGTRIFLKCRCLRCGNITTVRKDSVLNGKKASCGCLHSKGEAKIENFFQKKNIIYKKEYSFQNLIDKNNLRFDFAIFSENNSLIGLIEYQGIQHFEATSGWNNKTHLELTLRHDKLKKEYCQNNNLKLYYITYKDNIEERLEEILNELYCK